MNFSVFTKPLCRFLIHRYMGQYLKTELTSDQLEFRLADGTATVQGVMLNSDFINETLESSGVKIISFVDGYVEELTVCVPWKRLLNDSTIIKVSGLQITLTPLADINTTNTQELVSSFIGSIASSMDLAKSVIVDEQLATESDSGGIEQFATLIDQIISRIKVIFENITIRIESYSETSGLCTGIEIQIDKMEFLDENLEEQMRNAHGAITEQPARLYTTTDLNKLLHIQGVRLYTDIWTPLKNNKLINSQINSSDSEGDTEMTALNFQSCYSHFSSRSNSNTATRPQNLIPPNPILFAQFFSEKHTLRIRVNNSNAAMTQTDNSSFNKRIDIDIFLGGPLYIFLTPSQIMLLQNILSLLLPKEKEHQPINNTNANNFGGLPMNKEHFNRMMEQIQEEFFETEQKQKFVAQKGTWSGTEQYHEFADNQNDYKWRKIIGGQKFRPNSPAEMEMEEKNHSKTGSTTTLVERRPNIFTISLRAPTLIVVLTHDDPLSKDSMEQYGEMISQTFPNVVNTMVEKAEHFFKTAAELKLNKKKIAEQGALLSNLYKGDCLRLLANGFFASYSLTSECQRNLMEIEGHLDECDFKECLWSEESSQLQSIDIMCLSNANNNVGVGPVMTFKLKNTLERENDYFLNIDIENCKAELDPSIMDRIANLLFIQPYFLCKNSIVKPKFEAGTAPLDDKLLQEPLENSESLISFSVKCYCASLKLKLRIPIADLSKIELPKKRELHQECLLLEFEGAEIVLPKSVLADIPVHWTMNLQCKSAKGTFSGDPNFMECTNEAMTFFCADATNAERTMGNVNGIKLTISFDKRNKSLSKILLAPENLNRSITESIFNANDREKIEGPFSTKDTFHFKDGTNRSSEDGEPSQKLIKAGSRKELMEFADECRTLSNLLIDISIGQLNLSLPSRKFLEILYNRFANDLALWEPRASKSKKKNSEQNVKEFLECQSAFMHENEEEIYDERDADELSEITNFSKRTTATLKRGNYRSQKIESHQFSFGIHIERARILIQRTNNVDAEEEFQSQVGMELLNADSFLVYGFKGDPNLTYFFTTSTNAELYHKNLFTQNAFSGNVADFQTFMLPKPKENIYLNEVPKDHNFERINDDNFVLSLKMYFHENTNTKDILLAFGLRNSLLHVRPFERIEHFWAKQFADFLNIADYGVPGYVPPTINADLRIHFSTVYLGYNHSSIIQNSPFQLRLEIGSSYISTYLVENIERLKFDCIFEDTNLWMRKKIQESVKFELQTRFYNPANNFVKILMSDSIHFILAYTLILNGNSPGPAIDFACADQNLTLWLCSDTIVEFLNIFKELFCSDIVKKFLTSLKSNESELQEKNEQNDMKGKFERQESVPSDKGAIKRNVSVNDEERLVRDMEAAIHDIPTVFHTNMAKHMEMMMDDEEDEYSAQAMAEMDNADDEFIVIDKVPARAAHKPGIGVTQIGSRFQTHFDSGGDFEFVTTQINIATVIDDLSDEQPPDQSLVLISYKLRFSSLTIFLFGGSDFADSARALPQKIYSQWEMNRDISLFDEVNSQGGRYRDHTVLVEIKFTRLSTICKLFNESSPNLSSVLLELGDFSIIDHLSISQINEMVHRLEIEGQPKSSAPFLKVFLKEDQLREAIMRITLAPIRLNFDQDTFDFLIDFKNDLAQGLRNVFDIPAIATNKNDDDVPVMEVPKTTEANDEDIGSRPTSHASTDNSNESSLHQSFSKGISFNDLKKKDEQTAANIEELFSEDDVVLGDSVYDEKCSAASSRRGSDLIRQTESPSTTISENIKKELEMETINKSKSLAAKSTFIKDFTFSPACRLRIDYEAKNRIRTEHQGPFLAFLLGMTNLKKTELVLKEIRVEKGFLGFGRCAQFVVDEWQNDIINKQLRNVVGGVAVINAVVQLAQGFKDLVVYPLEEYQKENGQLARGLQRGTSSFGLNAATAAIDATQRIVGLVQNIAELTYDILNPNFVYQQGTQPMHIPGDLREGFSLACETVREGIVDTTQSLQSAAERDRARGGWGVGILRHITPTAIKPIVVASKATSHVLGGLKNQLKPEEHKEEMRKWRHNTINGKRSFEQLRRQQSSSSTSSSTQQPSSSSGSFTRTYDIPPRKNW